MNLRYRYAIKRVNITRVKTAIFKALIMPKKGNLMAEEGKTMILSEKETHPEGCYDKKPVMREIRYITAYTESEKSQKKFKNHRKPYCMKKKIHV